VYPKEKRGRGKNAAQMLHEENFRKAALSKIFELRAKAALQFERLDARGQELSSSSGSSSIRSMARGAMALKPM
jgi:dephospho-CoA kinase